MPGRWRCSARLRAAGPTIVLTDGDAVFQPRKIARAGIRDVADDVLVYVHKEEELEDVERRYPAERYVLVDDKVGFSRAVKRQWGDRVTTVLPLQGQFANDPTIAAAHPAPDVTVGAASPTCSTSTWRRWPVDRDREKRIAAEAAAALVEDGMRVGLGTGSTVAYLLPALARRGLDAALRGDVAGDRGGGARARARSRAVLGRRRARASSTSRSTAPTRSRRRAGS